MMEYGRHTGLDTWKGKIIDYYIIIIIDYCKIWNYI